MYVYNKEDFDIFAVYIVSLDLCCYISNTVLDNHRSGIVLRTDNIGNYQVKNTHLISDYTDFLKSIKQ
jgi:hypothetical protein